jgi:hypothetical protein
VSVNDWPAMLMIPDDQRLLRLGAATKLTVPLPVPDAAP